MEPSLESKNVVQTFHPGKKKKEFKISLIVKVTAIIAISIALVASLTNFLIYSLSYNALRSEIRNKLMMIASAATVTLDTEKLKMLTKTEDEGNTIYMELQEKLLQVKEICRDSDQGPIKGNEKLRYIYTLAKSGDKVIYILDAAPITDTKNHSRVGDEFPVDEYPKVMDGFIAPTSEKNLSYDKEFNIWSQSGYAPIKDKNGKVIGVLGVDMDVTALKKDEAKMQRAIYIVLGIVFVLALLLGIIVSRYLTKPIIILTKGTKTVAEGNFDIAVDLKHSDEFGQLASSFNSMTHDLKESREKLKRYNMELEDKVAQRTAELLQINKEIKDILDNMSQAIFTIDSEFKFNAQHSRFAFNIFGKVKFADKNILDIFFPLEEQGPMREKMASWLNKIFEDRDMAWENLEALQPVREIAIQRTGNEQEAAKYIKFDFQPITDTFAPDFHEKVTKAMVIVQDITEKKVLELEMEKKQKEYKDNISQIVEVIKMDQELFQDFITECQDNLVKFEPKLIQLKGDKENMDLINDLSRIMHSIKGNAKIFNLERIAGEAHNIENIFSSIRKGERVMTDELLSGIFKKLDDFNTLFNETLDIYNKIVSGMNVDKGKTRSEERQKKESQIIKVRVREFNRLAELVEKADRLIGNEVTPVVAFDPGNEKLAAIETLLKETAAQLKSMRKIELGRLFTRFHRMARDISMELGKKVKLTVKGEDIEVDKNIFDKIGDPLIHIIRNSLDHGIEKPEERARLGKPKEGTIELTARLTDSELLIVVNDDGSGLDVDKIKVKAVKNELITADKALHMPDDEAIHLIFLPGFSINDEVTEISGRGIGMDVVKKCIEETLGGTISLKTGKNLGMNTTISIPLID